MAHAVTPVFTTSLSSSSAGSHTTSAEVLRVASIRPRECWNIILNYTLLVTLKVQNKVEIVRYFHCQHGQKRLLN
jgi:hypothetical protein